MDITETLWGVLRVVAYTAACIGVWWLFGLFHDWDRRRMQERFGKK